MSASGQNIEHATLNSEVAFPRPMTPFKIRRSMLNVRCSSRISSKTKLSMLHDTSILGFGMSVQIMQGDRSSAVQGRLPKLLRFNPSSRSGLTLLELLVVLAIIGILASLVFASLGPVLDRVGVVTRTNHLRQIGQLIHSYTADNNGLLPGPLWPGQIGVYDPDRDGRLANRFLTYLGMDPDGGIQTVPVLLPRPLLQAHPDSPDVEDFRPYVMNIEIPGREEGSTIQPWGSMTSDPPTQPLRISYLPDASPTWAISEADQLHPTVMGRPWSTSTIPEPLRHSGRLAWFFDGRIESLLPANN